jgi:hypothetical protein
MSDNRDLARVETAPPPVRQSNEFLAAILSAAKDPAVDADKVKTLADLAVSLQDREREMEFNRDLNAAIMEMPVITKDGRIVIRKPGEADREQGRFARLEDIDRVVRPIAARHNLAYSWDVGDSGSGPVVAIILTHANGYQVQSSGMKMPLDTSGGKNNVQGAGSAVTYGKRYTLCARFNIQTEGADDDGTLGRGQTVTLPHERAATVEREAAAAHEAGAYGEFFSRQSPKDRAYLISSGKHAEYGGQPVIAPPKPAAATAPASTPPPPPPPPPPPSDKPMTARQWLAKFKADVAACQKGDDLDLYMDASRESLDKLKVKDEALWKEAQDAYQERKTAFAEGRLV